jgi:hypothetical protein
LAVFGSVLCHDCRGDPRRADAALRRAARVGVVRIGRLSFGLRRAA